MFGYYILYLVLCADHTYLMRTKPVRYPGDIWPTPSSFPYCSVIDLKFVQAVRSSKFPDDFVFDYEGLN